MTPDTIRDDVEQLRTVYPALRGALSWDGLAAAVRADVGGGADAVSRGYTQGGGFALEYLGAASPVFVIDVDLADAGALWTLLLLWGQMRYAPTRSPSRAAIITRPQAAGRCAPALAFAIAVMARAAADVSEVAAAPEGRALGGAIARRAAWGA